MGRLMGLEPTTFGFTVRRSNQLSYSRHIESTFLKKQPKYMKKYRFCNFILYFLHFWIGCCLYIDILYIIFGCQMRLKSVSMSSIYVSKNIYRNTYFLFLWTNNIYSSIEFVRQMSMTYDMLSFVGGWRHTPWVTKIFITLGNQVEFYS